jgi:hypothetical protein
MFPEPAFEPAQPPQSAQRPQAYAGRQPTNEDQTEELPVPASAPPGDEPTDEAPIEGEAGETGPIRKRVAEPLHWVAQPEPDAAGAGRNGHLDDTVEDEAVDEEDFDDSFQGEAWDREEASAHRR